MNNSTFSDLVHAYDIKVDTEGGFSSAMPIPPKTEFYKKGYDIMGELSEEAVQALLIDILFGTKGYNLGKNVNLHVEDKNIIPIFTTLNDNKLIIWCIYQNNGKSWMIRTIPE